MRKIIFILLLALSLGASGLSGQNIGFWLTTEGAGLHFNGGAPGYPPPPPHEYFYGGPHHHHRHHPPRHERKHHKKLKKSYKKYVKAQKKYYKARHDYIKARSKAYRHHRHHDDD